MSAVPTSTYANISRNSKLTNTKKFIIVLALASFAIALFFVFKKKKNSCPAGDSCTPVQENTIEGICDNTSNCLPTACDTGYNLNTSSLTCSKIIPGQSCTPPVSPIANALTYRYGSTDECDEVEECVDGYNFSDDRMECEEINKPPRTTAELKECVFNNAKSCVITSDKCKSCITKPSPSCVRDCLGECQNTVKTNCLADCDVNTVVKSIETKCTPGLAIRMAACLTNSVEDKKACFKDLVATDSSFVSCAMDKINDTCSPS